MRCYASEKQLYAFLWTSLACCVGLVSPCLAEDSLRIVTWNAREVFSPSEASARGDDFEEFAENVEPDILLLQEVNSYAVVERIRDKMGLDGYHVYCSNFETSDAPSHNAFEVAIISRLPAFQVIEYDPSPDNSGEEQDLEESPMPKLTKLGLQDVSTSRGFLWAHFPQVRLTVINLHLKSSGGSSGGSDHSNAAKRELVAAAVADCVNEDLGFFPNHVHLVAGDYNVGHSDTSKNGQDIANDTSDGYDDTHALLRAGIVDGLKMRNLIGHISTPTYPSFPGTPIDNIYVVGSLSSGMQDGEVISETFGSDHCPVLAAYTVPESEDVNPLAMVGQLSDFPNVRARANPEDLNRIFGLRSAAGTAGEPAPNAPFAPRGQSEVERLKQENEQLKRKLEELKSVLSN